MSPLAHAARALVRGYRLVVRPWLPPACRFTPSCSDYALEALARHGALKGGWLSLKRVLRCHPWGGVGYDPVPGNPVTAGRTWGQRGERCTHAPKGGRR